jgi:hypothetical protein
MKPLRYSLGLVALGLLTTAAVPAEAAWNNVFQVTCHCRPRSSVSSFYVAPAPVAVYSAPAAGCCDPCPCPQTQCTTRYIQRCYYQPVTTYQTQTCYEPVTTYTTKTYYEPVTTYRYSCYYDPCSCSYQQVATPVVSYVARQQCCPVQTWVQRCCQVPVTAYQKSFYWEPQTTCCTTTSGPPVVAVPGAPPGQPPVVVTPPGVEGRQTPPPPTVDGKSNGGSGSPLYDQYYGQPKDQQQSQYRQLAPNGPLPVPAKPGALPPPSVKLERIALGNDTAVEGKVVSAANAPKAGVRLTFVSAQRQSADKTVTSNAAGQFQVQLPPGGWLVYVRTAEGQEIFHSRIEIDAQHQTPIVLVSR